MTETLAKLIRYHSYLVDEQRRVLREREELAASFAQSIDALDAEIASEQAESAQSVEFPTAYGAFFSRTLARKRQLQASLKEAEAAVEEQREAVREAFEELKRYEITKDNHDARIAAEFAAAEQGELDEMALGAHRRKGEEG